MANNSNGNSVYVDSTGSLLTLTNVKLLSVTVTATSANAVLVLANNDDTASTRIDLRNATSGTSQHFRYEHAPLVFPNGIQATTVTNCHATLVYTTQAGGST